MMTNRWVQTRTTLLTPSVGLKAASFTLQKPLCRTLPFATTFTPTRRKGYNEDRPVGTHALYPDKNTASFLAFGTPTDTDEEPTKGLLFGSSVQRWERLAICQC